ncbi:MAG: carbonic anhydrase [Deltaproteobacteria bacterium]|nr:MAG: carbonic anhydrase [Deltaproteobacteria bacterium]
MHDLIEGVGRFMGTVHAKEKALFERLAHSQSPTTFFLTCSDSRVDPSLITQTEPGEMFVLRNAGNIIPRPEAGATGEAATLEYAVELLRVPDLIVCGHSNCGAMQGVLHPEKLLSVPNVDRWLRHASPTRGLVDKNFAAATEEVRWLAAVELNVLVQIEHLRLHPFARRAMDAGRLAVHAWVYDIGSGEVRAFDTSSHRFERINETTRALEGSPAGTPAEWPF